MPFLIVHHLTAPPLPLFVGYQQHDAHEFLTAVLDTLRSALRMWAIDLSSLGACSTLNNPNHDFVSNNFQGNTLSTLTCKCCGNHRSVTEPYLCLSLPLQLEPGRVSPVIRENVSPVLYDPRLMLYWHSYFVRRAGAAF